MLKESMQRCHYSNASVHTAKAGNSSECDHGDKTAIPTSQGIHMYWLQESPALPVVLAELMNRQKVDRPGLMFSLSLSGTGKTELAKQTAKYIHKDIKKVMAHLCFVLSIKGYGEGCQGVHCVAVLP